MTEFVLLHGTTQSPEGWQLLRGALAERGHRSFAVDLPSAEDLSADDYASLAQRQLVGVGPDPVVVAHSGAGLILPAVARQLGAQRQVWLAAMIPDGVRSLLEEVADAPEEMFNGEWLGHDPAADPVTAAYFLFHDCDLDTLQWALRTTRSFYPQRAYRQPVKLESSIPSTYLVCVRDRTLRPEWTRREAQQRLAATIAAIDGGHCPHVSRPQQLAEVLTDASTPARR